MGINSHVLPGDILVTTCKAPLLDNHPDDDPAELDAAPGGRALSGLSGMGHAFFVMTANPLLFGWLRNFDVSPIVAQRLLERA